MRKHMSYQLVGFEKPGVVRIQRQYISEIFKNQLSNKNNHINDNQIQNNRRRRLRWPVTIIRHSVKF